MASHRQRSWTAPLVRRHVVAICACALVAAAAIGFAQSAPGDYKSYPLRYKSAADMEKMLADVLPAGTAQVIADARNKQILVRGPEKAQQIARKLIDSVDRPPVAATSQPELRAYACAEGKLGEGSARLKALYANDASVRVASDAPTGQLLVVAPPEIHEVIPRQLAGVGVRSVGEPSARRAESGPLDRTLSLTNSRIDQIEPMLRELLGPRMRPSGPDRPGGAPFTITGPKSQQVSLDVNRLRGSLRVAGPQPLAGQVAKLIETLDSPRQPAGKTIQVVPLRAARAITVREALEAYRGGQEQPEPAGAPAAPPDDQSRAFGRRDIRLASFLQEHGQPAQPAQEVVKPPAEAPVDEADAAAQRRERLRALGVDLEIETFKDLDVIILRGSQRDVDEMMRIIQEIERLSTETEPKIDVYRLKYVGSEQLAAMLTQVNKDLVTGRQGRVSVTPLSKPNALLLIGWGESLKAVRQLIARLDQPVAPETQFQVFRLRHAPAATASTTVEQFFSKRNALGTKLVVTADVRSNSLLVQASPRDMAEVALLISRLDTPRSEAVSQVRVFHLKNSLAADLAATLQAAIDAARAGPSATPAAAAGQKSAVIELLTIDAQGERILKSGILNDVKITPDPRANTLLVTAPAESIELVGALIRQLDEAPASVAQIKVFRVVNGDAASLVQMLRALLPAAPAGTAPQRLASAEGETSLAPLRFSVDARTNTIIAAGSIGDLNIIEALLLRLDEKDVKQRRNAVYRLKNAPAIDVAQAINEFLRSERQVQQAAPGAENPFQQIESEVVVVPEPVSNGLIISATPRFFDDIKDLVEQLDSQPLQVMIQVLIGEVRLSNADEFGIELGIQDSLLFDRSLVGDLVTTTNTTTFGNPPTTTQNQTIVGASNTPGFNFNNQPLGNSASDRALANSSKVGGQALSSFAVGRINNELGYGGMVLSASSESVSVLVRALQESRRMEVLARPQVMTLDNQPAYIQVGQRVPRVIGTTINQVGQVNNIALENVGLILGVTPRISPEGKVVMEIDAEKSEVGAEAEGIPVSISATGEVIRSPRIDIATAQTTVSAADGETIVLGGLITRSRSQIDRRVPLLSNIPILGELFRYSGKMSRRTELLIILTPHVVRTSEDLERLKQAEAAKLSWCAADVHAIHGPTGICHKPNCPICNAEIPIIYPDRTPRGIEMNEPPQEAIPPGPELPQTPGQPTPAEPPPNDPLQPIPIEPAARRAAPGPPRELLSAQPSRATWPPGSVPAPRAGYDQRGLPATAHPAAFSPPVH